MRATIELESRQELWSGRSIGPGDLDIAGAHGEFWALFMRPPARGSPTLQPYIDRLSG